MTSPYLIRRFEPEVAFGANGPPTRSDENRTAVMLHLRIITPPDLTTTVLQELAEDPGVTHITADRGAATQPPGDLVSCDVVRASVNPLLRRLRSAGVAERGGITMTEPEAVISTAADHAQAQILAPEIDTVVWEEVSARTSDDSVFSVSFGALMVLAGIIAAIAVLTNNPVLVVGAMIVSPDYGPMAALSVALVNRAYGPAWRSFRALALGFPMAALAAFLLILAARGLGRIPAPYLAGERPVTGLLIGANLGAFVVAFVAGAAGIIALGRAKSGAVVGVLVSITTIPAASNVGVALAMGNPSEAGKSLVILVVNLAGLLTGGVLTLLGTRVWGRRIEAGRAIFRPKSTPRP